MSYFTTNHKERARKWYATCLDAFAEEVKLAVDNTQIYTAEDSPKPVTGETTDIKVWNMDTVSALFQFDLEQDVIAVLNFASYKNPGGGFIKGMKAQEEDLCHQSVLYPVLKKFEDGYYDYNRKHLNYGLYEDRLLYSESIYFEDEDAFQYGNADVITCAAPNMSALKYRPEKISENKDVLYRRAKFIVDAASQYKVDVLILGAWGCGVFKQDPATVADAFKQALKETYIKQVVFAVPGKDKNYTAFRDAFSK